MNKHLKYTTKNENVIQAILEFKPHKRTIKYGETTIFINIPFYTIFKIKTIISSDLTIPIQNSYTNRIYGSKNPITSLKDDVYTIQYPHVAPLSGHICQTLKHKQNSFNDYIKNFINQFWTAQNMFFMNNEFAPTTTCLKGNIQYIKEVQLLNKTKLVKEDQISKWIKNE